MTPRVPIWLVFWAAALGAQLPATIPPGAVQGVVVDENGTPVAGASVWCTPGENPPVRPATISDSEGRFLLENVPVGPEVFVSAYKESDGFPYNFFKFFKTSEKQYAKVKVESGKTATGAVIQLTRAAILNLEITDNNGTPLEVGDVTLEFIREDDTTSARFSTNAGSPRHSMLVPPVPFRFTLAAAGYQLWRSEVVSSKPGTAVVVTARLNRK